MFKGYKILSVWYMLKALSRGPVPFVRNRVRAFAIKRFMRIVRKFI